MLMLKMLMITGESKKSVMLPISVWVQQGGHKAFPCSIEQRLRNALWHKSNAMWNSSPLETLDKTKIISHQVWWRLNWKTCICCCTLDIYWFNIIELKTTEIQIQRSTLRGRRRRMFFCRTLPLNLFCCQYLLRCQMTRLNRSKEFGIVLNFTSCRICLSLTAVCW